MITSANVNHFLRYGTDMQIVITLENREENTEDRTANRRLISWNVHSGMYGLVLLLVNSERLFVGGRLAVDRIVEVHALYVLAAVQSTQHCRLCHTTARCNSPLLHMKSS